ncbi:uncharacterized protein [Coffea arabica]|uniref:Uncharacterized protein isoform X2 n=1 Tax=Coffea arabica TaxID=13443 RepID=A0ABM4VG95_COFAR
MKDFKTQIISQKPFQLQLFFPICQSGTIYANEWSLLLRCLPSNHFSLARNVLIDQLWWQFLTTGWSTFVNKINLVSLLWSSFFEVIPIAKACLAFLSTARDQKTLRSLSAKYCDHSIQVHVIYW